VSYPRPSAGWLDVFRARLSFDERENEAEEEEEEMTGASVLLPFSLPQFIACVEEARE